MRLKQIFIISSLAGWAATAPAENVALDKRQNVDVNGCWCCGLALQPHENFYGAGIGCKASTSTTLLNLFQNSI
jgi:hypothetical protein